MHLCGQIPSLMVPSQVEAVNGRPASSPLDARDHGVEDLETLRGTEVHILMAQCGILLQREGLGISHAYFNPLVQICNCGMAMDLRHTRVLDMEIHVPLDESNLIRSLLPRSRENKNLGAAA
jgi:hypothetical protein